MSKKSGSGLEQHIDKVILGVVGIICLYVLYAYVVTSPWTVEYDGEWYRPADLDKAINTKAKRLEDAMNAPAKQGQPYKARLPEFNAMLTSPLKNIEVNMVFPMPYASSQTGGGMYDIPKVCDVNNVKARLMATVAYTPKKPLDADEMYATAETKLADLDFVTVEATIDAAELSKRFAQSFKAASARSLKKKAWIIPVFAAVQLERQHMQDNGSWSEWQIVPRTQISEMRSYSEVPQKVDKLNKSIEILMLQFNKPETKAQLLQPDTYDFAYPAESWLPPTLADKRQVKLDKEKDTERQRLREDQRKLEEEKSRSRATTKPAVPAGGRAAPAAGAGGGMPGMGAAAPRPAAGTRPASADRTARAAETTRTAKTAAVKTELATEEQEYAKLKITDKTDFSKMKEPLLFWTHDDTAEPGKTYRYRIKIGVFDPVAGTESFREKDMAIKNDVILWSGYSAITEPVAVPARWYFFPVACNDADKMVTMRVCRYMLAKWYAKDFRVKPGEVIGTLSENVKKEDSGENEPNEIDYSNNAILVDVTPAVDKDYVGALYTTDPAILNQIAVKQQYWPGDLKEKFAQIERLQKEQKDRPPVFISRSGDRSRGTPRQGTVPGGMPGMGMPGMGMPGLGMPGAPR